MFGGLVAVVVFLIGCALIARAMITAMSQQPQNDIKENARSSGRETPRITRQTEQELRLQKVKLEDQQQRQQRELERQFEGGMETPVVSDGFEFKNATLRSDSGMIRVIGEVTNRSGKSYSVANFTVTLYDKKGKLLDTGHAIVSNLENGQTKSFEAPFTNVTTSEIDKYRIQFENGL